MVVHFIEERRKLRLAINDILPKELNTDFNLDRWIKNYDGDLDLCIEKFKEYIEIKKAFGLTHEVLETYNKNEEFINFVETFGLSTFEEYWINDLDNAIVFMECGLMEPSKAPNVIRASDYTRLIFSYAEYFQHLILKHEKKSGKPSYGICIFDMSNINILDYANPFNDINKLFHSRVQVWFDYFGEVLKYAILINPPRFLGVIMQVMSIILPAKLFKRFTFIYEHPYEMLPYLSIAAIPTFCGGNKELSVITTSRKIDKEEFLFDGEIWDRHNIFDIPYEEVCIGSGELFEINLDVKSGQKLLYEYFCNRDYEVRLTHSEQGIILPRIKLSTPALAEERAIPIKEDGKIKIEFKNLSKMMKMKLKIALMVV